MNDPNGLVVADGVYHLFYQYHPQGLVWGPMHWGHATSRDLVSWTHHPVALTPDELGTIFSGSVIVDRDGVAGFGRGAMLAFFTYFADPGQTQAVASSVDGGITWSKYVGNPILVPDDGCPDFRDPKVVPVDDGWAMILAAGSELRLFRSDDLLSWTQTGALSEPGFDWAYETPDLVSFGDGRWAVTFGVEHDGPVGGSGTRYLPGRFDGAGFVIDGPGDWADRGADFYAAQSWRGADTPTWLGWMSNWLYAQATPPVDGTRGAMSTARTLRMADSPDGPMLTQAPIVPDAVRGLPVMEASTTTVGTMTRIERAGTRLDVSFVAHGDVAVAVRSGTAGVGGRAVETLVTVEPRAGRCSIDRSRSGAVGFHDGFGAVHTAAIPQTEAVDARIVVGETSVELFVAGGSVVLSDLIFPPEGADALEFRPLDGAVVLGDLSVVPLSGSGGGSDAQAEQPHDDPVDERLP